MAAASLSVAGAVVTEIREAPRELLALVCAMRTDWGIDETRTAILASRTAGREWKHIAVRLVDIALRDETPPTRPAELWDDLRGVSARIPASAAAGPGLSREERDELRANALAACVAASEKHGIRETGPQPALRDSGPIESLREGHDP